MKLFGLIWVPAASVVAVAAFANATSEAGEPTAERKHVPKPELTGVRPIISKSYVEQWVPHGYVVIHCSSPGTGLSQGCPTSGLDNESLAPKAVITTTFGRIATTCVTLGPSRQRC